MKTQRQKIIVSVTNDLVTDNRVHKVCTSLTGFGFEVLLVGRKLPVSPALGKREYATKRIKLLFKKGPCFYAEFNLRLFLLLLFSKTSILLSNDLDTLPANYLVSKLRKKKLVFDSHEYFTEVPELINRPRTQKIWRAIEKRIVPKLKHAYTVCDSIAGLFLSEYNTRFEVVRNIPRRSEPVTIPENKKLNTPKKIIIYQGAVNIGRGLPEVISAMQYLEDALLVIVGSGDILAQVKTQVADLNLGEKVLFAGRIPAGEVKYYTAQASLGLSIEKDMGLNYRFALPNKLFDYIKAGVPVMVTSLPEMAKIVDHYKIGIIIKSHEPKYLAGQITEALNNDEARNKWEINLTRAARELSWENEEKVLRKVFDE